MLENKNLTENLTRLDHSYDGNGQEQAMFFAKMTSRQMKPVCYNYVVPVSDNF